MDKHSLDNLWLAMLIATLIFLLMGADEHNN